MFYNLAAGGDATNNHNWAMYPQRALVIGSDDIVKAIGATPLMPAEHMASATYNIWRNVNFGHERFPTNLGVREWLKGLYGQGQNIADEDIIGLVTLPRLAVLRGVMLTVNGAQPGTIFDVVSLATGQVLIAGVDASATGVYYTDVSGFVVPMDTNDILGIRVASWPDLETDDVDPCGVYGPCDDLSLCITLNAFIWSPVSADFCNSDPCYGVNSRAMLAAGTTVTGRTDTQTTEQEVGRAPSATNSSIEGAWSEEEGQDVLTIAARDYLNHALTNRTLYITTTNGTVSPATVVTDASGNASATLTDVVVGIPTVITVRADSATGPIVVTYDMDGAV